MPIAYSTLIIRLFYRLRWWLTGRSRQLAPVAGGMHIANLDPRYLQPSDVDRLTGIAYR